MPAELDARVKARGLRKVRTIQLPDGRYAHVFVVRKAGPRGGHTELGKAKRKKTGGK